MLMLRLSSLAHKLLMLMFMLMLVSLVRTGLKCLLIQFFFNMKGGKLELNSFGNFPKSNSVVLSEKEVPFPLLNHLMTSEKNSSSHRQWMKVWLIESGSWQYTHALLHSIPYKQSSFLNLKILSPGPGFIPRDYTPGFITRDYTPGFIPRITSRADTAFFIAAVNCRL